MKDERWPRLRRMLSVALFCGAVAGSTAMADVWDVGPPFGGGFLTDDTLIDTPNLLVHGAVQVHDLAALDHTTPDCSVPPCPDRDWYAVLTPAYTSHEVVVDGVSPYAAWTVQPPAASMEPPSLTRHDWAGAVLQQAETIGTAVRGASASLRWETGAETLGADYVAVAYFKPPACGTHCDANAQYTLRFYETTGAISRFSNFGGQVSVVILQNTATGTPGVNTITGTIHFFGSGPGTPLHVPFTIIESQGYVLNTWTIPELSGQVGRITISHNGRFGQLVGKVTTVDPARGFSFDTAMETMPH
jgi:hypothetical protein